MEEHLCKFGFMPNYTRWVYHGEAHCIRVEVVRQHFEEFDGDVGVIEWLDDFHEVEFGEGRTEEENPESTTKAFYDMLDLA